MKPTSKESTATRKAGLSGYAPFLAVVKNRIRAAQVKATLSANAELIHLYWDIGRAIVAMQEKEGWGAGVIPRLARDIANDMPEVKGFSERNIGRMIVFYREYPDLTAILPTASAKLSDSLNGQQPAAQLPATAKVPPAVAQIQGLEILPTLSAKTPAAGDEIAIEPTPLAQLPWSHHILLIQKVKDRQTRFWYARQADCQSAIQPTASRRYDGKASKNERQRCSAGCQPAVSPIGNRQVGDALGGLDGKRIANPRYSRLPVGATMERRTEMSNELPQGWALAKIADVTETVPNTKPEDSPEREFGYVDISAIDNSNFSITEVKRFKGKDAPSRARRPIRANDVLFSNVRTYLRNVALVKPDCPAELCSTGFTVLRASNVIEPRYLFRYVLTNNFIDRVTPQQTGTHYPATSDRVVMAEAIALPPLAEQRRIVAKLEKLLGQVDTCQQRLAKIPVLLKRFRQSVLAAACSGRLTADWRDTHDADSEWPTQPLEELFAMRNGKSLTAAKRREGEVPVYGGNGLMGMHCEGNANGRVIVIGRVGAQCGNVHFTNGKVWVTDNAISLEAKTIVEPAFYAYFLRSKNLNQMSGGTGQPYVSQEILGPVETPVVPLPEQQEIVRRVESLVALADQIQARLAAAQRHVDALTPSLLARAFAGKLVPQDPTDEPAKELLERIQRKGRGHA